ncbi:winged helix-turn-helix transcriptional regulator [Paenibacillus sp. ATY16]|uniref:winged helix-turn-helix transcriptional regulator n=1 Tax=Paenibacillus sp. ATY16 TaxID=1759312 RepID=UPI000E2EEC47|nr:winged helix-turn-helix transcriptional regulator [Paenibacillus sp. ATY16]MCK9859444.1 winged helix-turn-helix transcriptional regulator [Paenibacillus sp. ATY16]
MEQSDLCPRVQKGMDLIGKRWIGLIIYQLLAGPQRFCAVQAALPISGRLLSERFKDLETEGIVTRVVYPEIPVRIEYSLTEKGRALEPVVREIEKWSREWISLEEQAATLSE